jgi:hypothetical protein
MRSESRAKRREVRRKGEKRGGRRRGTPTIPKGVIRGAEGEREGRRLAPT